MFWPAAAAYLKSGDMHGKKTTQAKEVRRERARKRGETAERTKSTINDKHHGHITVHGRC
jgi:hypothetical protein